MTKLLDQALEAVHRLSPDHQDYIARAILAWAEGSESDEIHPEDLPSVLEGLAQAERGEFASEEEVEALFRRLRE